MKNIEQVDRSKLAGLRGVLADIDGTISTDGKITQQAYEGLWRLSEAGLIVIPVTGRCAGWCDHIARFWPVSAIVGENGGFYFHHDGHRLHRRYLQDEQERAESRRKLDLLCEKILAEVQGTGIASDQPYRECDLAIDYCEDVPTLSQSEARRIQGLFEEVGAVARVSSIHVNGWFGGFNKRSTSMLCLRELFGADEAEIVDQFAFCGDSPNDEEMFEYFPLSFGMANINRFADSLVHPPSYVTNQPQGAGFREVADLILSARGDGA